MKNCTTTNCQIENNLLRSSNRQLAIRNCYITFASSCSNLTNSGTALASVPTTLPALFAGGRCIDNNSDLELAGVGAFSSIGLFFALMIPLSDGYRGSFNPF
jgi:hypothetical protein